MFWTVTVQVVILMILVAIGFTLAKTKILSDTGVKNITDMVLMVVTPCVIIKSFIREYDSAALKKLLLSFLIAALAHVLFIVIARLLLKTKIDSESRVLQFAVIFSNCGFMSLPLQEALLGGDGVFYGSAYIAIYQVVIWTYGLWLMSGDKKTLTAKKLILNPGLIAVVIGMIIFVFSIPIPEIVQKPIEYMAALNTPVPMIIIGYHLAHGNIARIFKKFKYILAIFLRLLILPAIAVAIMYACGLRGTMFVSSAISCCAPTGAMATMFAAKYETDTELSVAMVSLTTLLSIITMPIVITVTQYLA